MEETKMFIIKILNRILPFPWNFKTPKISYPNSFLIKLVELSELEGHIKNSSINLDPLVVQVTCLYIISSLWFTEKGEGNGVSGIRSHAPQWKNETEKAYGLDCGQITGIPSRQGLSTKRHSNTSRVNLSSGLHSGSPRCGLTAGGERSPALPFPPIGGRPIALRRPSGLALWVRRSVRLPSFPCAAIISESESWRGNCRPAPSSPTSLARDRPWSDA